MVGLGYIESTLMYVDGDSSRLRRASAETKRETCHARTNSFRGLQGKDGVEDKEEVERQLEQGCQGEEEGGTGRRGRVGVAGGRGERASYSSDKALTPKAKVGGNRICLRGVHEEGVCGDEGGDLIF